MQLTLRTLLAYRDDVLGPLETAQLGRRIEQSANARHLDQRVKELVRTNLPSAEELDPNTVAEYLDNTLSEDAVAPFERDCLASDASLSEVAACHQILSLVLTRPAYIPEHIRRRAFITVWDAIDGRTREMGVPWLASETQPASEAGTKDSNVAFKDLAELRTRVGPDAGAAEKPTADDVEDDSPTDGERSRWRTLALLAAAFVGTALLTAAIMLWMPSSSPDSRAHAEEDSAGGPSQATKKPEETETAPAAKNARPVDESPPRPADAANNDKANQNTKVTPALVTKKPERPAATKPAAPQDPAQQELAQRALQTTPSALPAKLESPSLPGAQPSNRVASKTPAVPQPRNVASILKPGPPPPLPTPRLIPPHVSVAKLEDNGSLVAHFNHEHREWRRLPNSGDLLSGQPFVAFRGQPAQFQFGRSAMVQTAGATRGTPLAPDGSHLSGLSLGYGRVLLTGKRNGQMRFEFGPVKGKVALKRSRTVAALEIRNYSPPGHEPHGPDAAMVVQLFLVAGSIEWSEPSLNQKVRLSKGQALCWLIGDPNGQPAVNRSVLDMRSAPDWARPSQSPSWFAEVKKQVGQRIAPESSLVASLQSISSETNDAAGYARECLVHVGQWEPALAGLGRKDLPLHWNNYLAALRTVVGFDFVTARNVGATMLRAYPDDAAQLFRLLSGYSEEQLAAGQGDDLVAALDHPQLCIRVAAFENLRMITGKTLLYRPEANAARRKPRVANWQRLATEKKLMYQRPPRQLLHVQLN